MVIRLSRTYILYYTLYTRLPASFMRTVSRTFRSSYLPLPTLGKEGKCGDTPHPVKGLPPLETLLRSTFEKLWNRSQVFDEGDVVGVPNFQFLYHYIISLNRSTGKLSHMNGSVSITSHWDARRSLSILHDGHSRHILHWPGSKVCGAVRAECPTQFQ